MLRLVARSVQTALDQGVPWMNIRGGLVGEPRDVYDMLEEWVEVVWVKVWGRGICFGGAVMFDGDG